MLMQELLPGLSRQKLLLLIVYSFCGGKGSVQWAALRGIV